MTLLSFSTEAQGDSLHCVDSNYPAEGEEAGGVTTLLEGRRVRVNPGTSSEVQLVTNVLLSESYF